MSGPEERGDISEPNATDTGATGEPNSGAMPTPRGAAVHGAIALSPAACTSCDLCVTECPAWCIELTSHNEPVAGPGRARTVKVLDTFTIDFGLCMYCGICVQVCPFDALAWVPSPVANGDRAAVVLELDELAALWPDA